MMERLEIDQNWYIQLSQDLSKYYQDGIKQFENIAYDQLDAKTGVLAAPLMGSNMNGTHRVGTIDLAGTVGTGKTTIAEQVWRLYGLTPEDVAEIPTDAELSPIRLTGGSIPDTISVVDTEGNERTETRTHIIDGIIKPHHKIVHIPEKSRINYEALNALFDISEYGHIKTSAGRVALSGAVMVIGDFNPEDKKTTNPLSTALQSRTDILVAMDDQLKPENRRKLRNGEFPNPNEVKPITSLEQIAGWQAGIDRIVLPDHLDDYADRLVETAIEKLKQERLDIHEGSRMHNHVGRASKILALFSGGRFNSTHVEKALRYAVGTRLGAIATRDLARDIDLFTADVIQSA